MEGLDIKNAFDYDIKDIVKKSKSIHYNPSRFLQMIGEYGTLETCHRLIAKQDNTLSEGLVRLQMAGKLEWSMEYVILKEQYRELFTDEERAICRKRLVDLNFDFSKKEK